MQTFIYSLVAIAALSTVATGWANAAPASAVARQSPSTPTLSVHNDASESIEYLRVWSYCDGGGSPFQVQANEPSSYLLRDGRKLTFTTDTPAGVYWLPDGREVTIEGDAYPRQVVIRDPPRRVLSFHIESRSRVGVLVMPDAGLEPPWPSLADSFARHLEHLNHMTYRATADTVARVYAYEYPRDWFRQAQLEVPRSIVGNVRVVWVAFGDDGSGRRLPLAALSRDVHAAFRVIGSVVLSPEAQEILATRDGGGSRDYPVRQ